MFGLFGLHVPQIQLSTIAILGFQFRLYHVIAPLSFLRIMHSLISGHPGGLTPGNPRAFATRQLQIPPTHG